MRKFPGLVFLVLITTGIFSYGESLIIAYEDKEQPPYYRGNGSEVPEEFPGIAVEMILALEQEFDQIEIELIRLPWPRCLYSLENNQVDGIFNASYKESRLEAGWYPTLDGAHTGPVDRSKRITTISYNLYRKDSDFSSLRDFSMIGAPLGYSIVEDLLDRGLEVYEFQSTETGFRMLNQGRLEGIVVQDITGDAILNSYEKSFPGIVKVEPPIETKDYFLMLSHQFVKENKVLAFQIWEALEDIRKKKVPLWISRYNKQ